MKYFKRIAIALLIVTLVAFIGIGSINLYVDSKLDKIDRKDPIAIEDALIDEEVIAKKERYNVVNIALIGADNGGNTTSFDRADATKIISMDYDNKELKITSVQRDILIWVPEPINDWDKLNHSHWYGGPELTIKTLNYNLDLDITKYVGFSFSSLSKIVDLVDGVDIYLTGAEAASVGAGSSAGTYRLYGQRALDFARIRNLDSDYGRMDRQNRLIEAIVNRVSSKSLPELMSIADGILPFVETNLTNDEIKSYLVALLEFNIGDIKQFQIPNGGYNDTNSRTYKGYSPLYLLRSYQDMVKELHFNIYGDEAYQPSARVIENEKQTYLKFGNFVE